MNITREWYHLIHRPFNVFPLPRSVINTRFILYTEKNPIEGQLLVADDKDGIKKTNFNPKWATKFIIHGFIDTPLSNWVSEMRDELIVRKNLNVIVVDWAGGSLPLYTQVSFTHKTDTFFISLNPNIFIGPSHMRNCVYIKVKFVNKHVSILRVNLFRPRQIHDWLD